MAYWARILNFIDMIFPPISNRELVLDNMKWMIIDRSLKVLYAITINIYLIQYLGPSQYGEIIFSITLILFYGILISFGLDRLVIKYIVENPSNKNLILGTSFVMQSLHALIIISILLITTYFVGLSNYSYIISLMGISLFFRPFDVIRYWFESQVQSKSIIKSENLILLFLAILRLLLIYNNKSISYFAATYLLEFSVIQIYLIFLYQNKSGLIKEWRFSLELTKHLYRESWPLLLSGIAVTLYMRVDLLMLGKMSGPSAVGYYSAALRISEMWYLLPNIITVSLMPQLIDLKMKNTRAFEEKLSKLIFISIWVSIIFSVLIMFSSKTIIMLLYGPQYYVSVNVLIIHVWTSIFVCLGSLGSIWYISQSMNKYTLRNAIVGAISNVALNFYLIPKYGPTGSACASLISQALSTYFVDYLAKPTRKLFWLKTDAILRFM